MAARRVLARVQDLAVQPARHAMPAVQPPVALAPQNRPNPSGQRQALVREIAQRVPAAVARQLTPLLGSERLARTIGARVARAVIRREPPPTLGSRPVDQTGPLAYPEWQQERQETPAFEGTSPPQSEMMDAVYVAEHAQRWADEMAADIRTRLEEQESASETGSAGGSGLGQSGDPAWLDEVVEHLTGVAYESAHPYVASLADWRRDVASGASSPPVLVCDQLGELIQYIRGIANYGTGLTGHMEHYLDSGDLHQSNVPARPGVTLFHVVPSSGHALDIEPGKRVPDPSRWSRAARNAARSAENSLLGTHWRSAIVSARREDASRADEVARVDRALDSVYDPSRKIQHETTIIRATTTPRGGDLIQLFDFEAGIAQEGTQWRGMNQYNNVSAYYWGYQNEGATRALPRPTGTGTITIEYQGDTLAELPLAEGSLLPLGRYRAVLGGLPYSDLLTVRLRIQTRGGETMEMTAAGAARPRMRDLTPPTRR